MCDDCYSMYGGSRDSLQNTPDAACLIDEIKWFASVVPGSGPLHVVLEDWNLEDGYLSYERSPTWGMSDEQYEAAARIVEGLKRLTLPQRAEVLRRARM